MWLDMRGRLLKVGPEICRHATLNELRACQAIAGELALQSKRLGQPSDKSAYTDLTGEPAPGHSGEEDEAGFHISCFLMHEECLFGR